MDTSLGLFLECLFGKENQSGTRVIIIFVVCVLFSHHLILHLIGTYNNYQLLVTCEYNLEGPHSFVYNSSNCKFKRKHALVCKQGQELVCTEHMQIGCGCIQW